MTSSNCFELALEQQGITCETHQIEPHVLPARVVMTRPIRAGRRALLRVQAPESFPTIHLDLGGQLVGVARPNAKTLELQLDEPLRDAWGEAIVRARIGVDDDSLPSTLFEILLPIESTPAIESLYETIIKDLEAIHLGLARDVLSRTTRTTGHGAARVFDPVNEVQWLTSMLRNMRRALGLVGQQPSSALTREPVRVRWRPGDRLDNRTVLDITRQGDLNWRDGRPQQIGRLTVARPCLSLDLPEHRHMRATLERLVRRADTLIAGCDRTIELISREQAAWGLDSGKTESVYSQRYGPRIRKLEEITAEAAVVRDGARALILKHDFVSGAGRPRRPLTPSPLFMRRRGYRDAFPLLRQMAMQSGALLDGQALRIHFRSLDVLYEYWCFIVVIRLLRERFGPPQGGTAFKVIDEVYRPELEAGQHFIWHLDRTTIRAYYEPAIPPPGSPENGLLGWRAALVGAPLRPDILVVHEQAAGIRALVLDAKNTTRYGWNRLFEATDYRTLIHDADTGRQPIRQVFFLHRDPEGAHCTYPKYFERHGQPQGDLSVLGSIPVLPDQMGLLEHVLARFFGAELRIPS